MEKASEPRRMGSRISACRQNRNMTQEELAGRLGITPQALSKWERGVSLPDISMLAELSRLLEVSADYLLGLKLSGEEEWAEENTWEKEMQLGIGNNLRSPLELVFGIKLVPLFTDNGWAPKVFELRKKLAWQRGIVLPIVRLKDDVWLEEQEFAVLAYHNVLYSEKLDILDEHTVDYMLGKLGECVRRNYHEILDPDLIRTYVDNLKIKCPALIEGVVPEKIPYSLLTETARLVLARGNSIIYLSKMIEVMDCALRNDPRLSAEELADRIRRVIEREDNIDVILWKRREKQGAEPKENPQQP